METADSRESAEILEATQILTALGRGEPFEVVEQTPKEKRKPIKWDDDEIRVLFLSKKNRNLNLKRAIYNEYACQKLLNDLAKHGYSRTAEEIKSKVSHMYTQYKNEKEFLEETGAKRSKWKYYEIMKRIVELDLTAGPLPIPNECSSDAETEEPPSKVRAIQNRMSSSNTPTMKLSIVGDTVVIDSDAPSSPPTHSNGLPQSAEDMNAYPREVYCAYSASVDTSASSAEPQIILPYRKILPKPLEASGMEEVGEPQPAGLRRLRTRCKRRDVHDILEDLLEEFRRANQRNQQLDEELVELLKESNDLCQQQNDLLSQLIEK